MNKSADLSPGFHTEEYAEHCAVRRKKSQETFAKPSSKARRLFLKKERAVNQSASESLEGATYQSGKLINFDPDPLYMYESYRHIKFNNILNIKLLQIT